MSWFISEFNSFAFRFIKKYNLAKAPEVTLIYGPRGVGKSTLLQELYLREINEGKLLTDARLFARQYAYAAQDDKLHPFRKRHRSLSLLLLDDLQLIEGKAKTIEELHYTYENIIEHGGKLVLTVEGELPALDFLGERLASRFSGGAILPINSPQDYEIKAFLEYYTHEIRIIVDDLVLKSISEQVKNLVDAKMHIKKFLQYAEIHEDELGFPCFQAYWEEQEVKRQETADPVNIIRNVSKVMGIPAEEMVSISRKATVNTAREMAIYCIRTLCSLSYPAIAGYFNRNHNTIMMSCKKMEEKLSKDQELKNTFNLVLSTFKTKKPENSSGFSD